MIKGRAKIQLFDADTGKLTKEVIEENLITNAVNNIINPPDFCKTGINTDVTKNLAFNPLVYVGGDPTAGGVAGTMFSGVLCFRDAIPEDPNVILMPWTNKEVGHAGGTTANEDSGLGTYNATESGVIENGNGYRHVWDFATDRANGEIGCICLTTRRGGYAGVNNYDNTPIGSYAFANTSSSLSAQQIGLFELYDDHNVSTSLTPFYMSTTSTGDVRVLSRHVAQRAIYEHIIAAPNVVSVSQNEPYCRVKSVRKVINPFEQYYHESSGDSWGRYYSETASVLNNSSGSLSASELEALWEQDPAIWDFIPYVHDGKIYIIGGYGHKVYIKTYDLETYTEISASDITIDDKVGNTFTIYNMTVDLGSDQNPRYQHFAYTAPSPSPSYWGYVPAFIYDDKLFIRLKPSSKNITVYAADGGESLQTITTDYVTTAVIHPKNSSPIAFTVCSSNYPFRASMLRKSGTEYSFVWTNLGSPVHGDIVALDDKQFPNFIVVSSYRSSYYVGVYNAILTTINNLAEPVEKTAGQVMKITYDLIDVGETTT